jgi:hypothetical protein
MQNIHLHNYQDFLLRYIDEELDLRETKELLAFVAIHPVVGEELETLQSTKLEFEAITCPNKAVLYKNIFPVIAEPTTIVYPNKQKLFKKEKGMAPVVFLRWWAVGVAALFIFIVARYGIFNGEGGKKLSKNNGSINSVTKSSVANPDISTANNAINNNTARNNAVVSTDSVAVINIIANKQNIATNTLEGGATQDIARAHLQTAYTVTSSVTLQNSHSYTGDIIDVKPTIIAEITVPFTSVNNETTEPIETIDTEAASNNRSVMVGAFEVDKDKFRGLFRKATALFKNKENNKNEK